MIFPFVVNCHCARPLRALRSYRRKAGQSSGRPGTGLRNGAQRALLSASSIMSRIIVVVWRPYWLIALMPYIARPRIIESLKDIVFPFLGPSSGA